MTPTILYEKTTGALTLFDEGSNVADQPNFRETPLDVTEAQVRQERDSLIAATDWWATSDRTMTAEQTAYRQALRDITGQAGFPDITWPTKPS
tara:strand:+ start:287 stop:565 length:279 start_codon:yes stop_codon:yes gene_type:complete